ncbi:FAD/NAD(P)-binding domain-containing protein [Ceraceosorus guamensis]|uniref:FAD/NAD(P)-binding domain-containing protein n=1 Tax=Ceraceosorus guamensis TaxID=1522189 RepID=A0A316VVB7_9BASI|nr:FAD/NAD(P)-binding domain-containing protein [Ceraceosorus guamensis]PWN40383.1 FAD/NAD(P)-binding domain-containing protein [Ceraceosorus guamensis]
MPRLTARVPVTSLHGNIPLTLPFKGEESVEANAVAVQVLAQLDACLVRGDWQSDDFQNLWVDGEDAWFKDHLALTGSVRTIRRSSSIKKAFQTLVPARRAANFGPDAAFQVGGPARFERLNPAVAWIDAPFVFDTRDPAAKCGGYLKLIRTQSGEEEAKWKIWVWFSALLELKCSPWGHPARSSPLPGVQQGNAASRGLPPSTVGGESAPLDLLVVGAGTAGLSALTCARALGLIAIAVDKDAQVGHLWKSRYKALHLHTTKAFNALPFAPFPARYPDFVSAEQFGTYLQNDVVSALKLPVYSGILYDNGKWDDARKFWVISLVDVDTGERGQLCAKNIVMANGPLLPEPRIPTVAAREQFRGETVHSSEFTDAKPWAGKRCLVVGTGASGHDISSALHHAGASSVHLVQRGPNFIFPIAAQEAIIGQIYNEKIPIEMSDLMWSAMPLGVTRTITAAVLGAGTQQIAPTLFQDLEAKGFRVEREKDFTHFAHERHGGHYQGHDFDLLTSGKVKVHSAPAGISHFDSDALVFQDGTSLQADLVVWATGFTRKGSVPEWLVEKGLIDAEAAKDVEAIGHGVDEEGEWPGRWTGSGHPALWFTGAEIQAARYGGKLIALQIAMEKNSELPTAYPRADVAAYTNGVNGSH